EVTSRRPIRKCARRPGKFSTTRRSSAPDSKETEESTQMIRKIVSASAAILLGLALVAPMARAQDQPTDVKDAKAEEAPQGEDPFDTVGPMPGWSIKPEVQNLGNSMKQFNTLIGSLNRANKDLSDEFQKYLKDPK